MGDRVLSASIAIPVTSDGDGNSPKFLPNDLRSQAEIADKLAGE